MNAACLYDPPFRDVEVERICDLLMLNEQRAIVDQVS